MRNIFGKSVFPIVVLIATLFSVARNNVVIASNDFGSQTQKHFVSFPKSQKTVQTYITDIKEFGIEDGEELDDENDENDENLVCFFKACVALATLHLSDTNLKNTSIDYNDHSDCCISLPLFIEFENFRL